MTDFIAWGLIAFLWDLELCIKPELLHRKRFTAWVEHTYLIITHILYRLNFDDLMISFAFVLYRTKS